MRMRMRLATAGAVLCVCAIAQQILIRTASCTIAASGTVSSAVYLGEYVPLALQMPAAFTGTSVTFQGSTDGQTFQEIYVGGAAYSETVAASKNVVLDASMFAGFEWIKVVSGSSEGAARTIVVTMRRAAR